MMGRFFRFFSPRILYWLVFGPVCAFAQLTPNNWYFGNSPDGIRFNRSTNAAMLVTDQPTPFGTGGSAVATDPANANILFITDGNSVYDASMQKMLNGAGLNATTSSNQPVAVCAVPGAANKNKYFIFTNTASFTTGGTISRSVVDMTQFGNAPFPTPALGDVENPKNVAIPGLTNRSEGMITVPHANGTSFWLISHQVNTQSYSATLINAASYTGTFTTQTSTGLGLPITVANFAYNAKLGKLAVAPQNADDDALILNFDNATGALTFDRYILNSGKTTTTNQNIYDIEWSNSGQYIYLSRVGETGINADLFQYDYAYPTVSFASVLPAPVFRSYGIQMAPDSAIYHLYQSVSGGPFLVGKLTQADTVAAQTVYDPAPFGATDFNGTQFSSFLPKDTIVMSVAFTSIGSCQNTPTTFFPDVIPGADSVHWDFGDGTPASNAWSPIHTYATANTQNVTLTAFYRGQVKSTTQPVTINAFPLMINLVQDTTACRSEFPPPRGSSSPKQFSVTAKVTGGTPASAIWSNGDTGLTLTPDSAGYYYVVVTDASGCSAYAGVNVKEYGLMDRRANIWYFGDHAGIDFNQMPAVPLNDSAMDAPEGCSIVCDRNGKAIFYTDGFNVYDKTHALIATDIGGDPLATQSALIVPVPGDETLYYIFTTQAVDGGSANELRYSLFDLKANGGVGAVVQQNVLMYARSTERITANGRWLVTHEYGNNTFRVYPITAMGIGDPVYSSIGSAHNLTELVNAEGYMKLGARSNLAVALSTPGTSNLIELFHLDDSTGVVTDYRKIDMQQPVGQVYGIEFSPGGNKLFATLDGQPGPSSVYEYFLDSLDQPHLRQTVTNAAELGAIQISPTGEIYMAINGSTVLGTIQAVEDTTQISPISFSGFNLAAGTKSQLGLPNFVQIISNAFGGPTFSFTGICLGDSTRFVGTATDAIDKFSWFFGDGGTDTDAAPVHLYATAKTYTVSMNLTNRCGLDTTLVKPVTIVAPPARPTLPGAAALCTGSVVLDANTGNVPGLTYVWTTGDTTQTLTLNQPAIVAVTNTDTNGCTSSAQSVVVDNRPQVDLGPDITICEDNSTPALNAQNPGATFAWTINGGSPSTGQVRTVDVTTPGVFVYQVTVTDPITTCSITDSKTYTVNVSPQFTLSGVDPSSCSASDGSITLQLNASTPAAGPYSYFLTGPGGFNQQGIDQTAPTTVGPIGSQPGGIFSGIVTDQISGCTISKAYGLSAAPFTASASAKAPNCDPVIATITTVGVTDFPLQYDATDNTGTSIGTGTEATAAFDIPGFSQGVYTIALTDNNNCTFFINNFTVTPNTPVPITITPDVCATPATITASGAMSYSWTGPGITSGANSATVQINPGQGQFTYTVVASAAGQCPNTQPITVNIDSSVTPTFTQSDACATSVILTASPSGPYTYRWYKSNVFQQTLGGQQISLDIAENGSSYAVEIVNTVNGCVYRSPAQTVNIAGVVDASLASTPPCLDGKPFTLTATTVASGATFTWYLDGTVIAGKTTASIDQTDEGTYKVEVTKATCTATSQIQITRAPLPVGNLPNRVVICDDPDNNDPTTASVDLDPGVFSAYNWLKNELTLNYTDQVLTADSKGIYKVELTNSFGCVAPDETEVQNDCLPKIVAPNAFRPTSNEAVNRDFFVYSFFITDQFQVFIYNRWGEMVYQSNDRYFKWDGSFNNNGKPLPAGTYAYVIKYVSSFRPDKGVQEKHGGVALIR